MLNNNSDVKSWINTLSHHFKVPMSVALGLLINESYTLDNAWVQQPPAQYVYAIIWHNIRYNIVDVAN